MSPEQVTDKEIDARSDLFSLGIILYLMLTGERPFTGDTAAVMFKIVYEDPVRPSKLNTQLSPAHDYLVLRLLAKDRDKRYESARQFLDDLDDVRSGRPPRSEAKVPASELPVGERTLVARPPFMSPPAEALFPPKRKVRWVAAGIGVALVTLGSALGVGLWKFRHPKAPPLSVAQATSQPPPAPQMIPTPPTTSAPQPPSPAPAVIPLSLPGQAGKESLFNPPTGPAPYGARTGKEAAGAPEEKKLEGKASGKARPPARPARAAPARSLPAASKPGATPPTGSAAVTQPAPAAPTAAKLEPSPVPTSAVSLAATGKLAAAASKIQIWCKHELKEGKLSVSNGAQAIFQANLKGRKKGGFHRITGGYEGLLSRALAVPLGTRDLTVHVTSPEGSIDLSNTIPFTPPAGLPPVLEVIVKGDGIQLNWRTPPPSKH
jgi:hypothetical protein